MTNLIQAERTFNCSKNDKLPYLDRYFEDFFELQKSAIEVLQHCAPKNKSLEDYLSIFPGLENIEQDAFKIRYRETLQPLITISGNSGFGGM